MIWGYPYFRKHPYCCGGIFRSTRTNIFHESQLASKKPMVLFPDVLILAEKNMIRTNPIRAGIFCSQGLTLGEFVSTSPH